MLTTASSSEPEVLYGDVNDDGEINSMDATLILKYDAGTGTLTNDQLKAADVSGDGEVDSADATLILKFDSGLITEFPAK